MRVLVGELSSATWAWPSSSDQVPEGPADALLELSERRGTRPVPRALGVWIHAGAGDLLRRAEDRPRTTSSTGPDFRLRSTAAWRPRTGARSWTAASASASPDGADAGCARVASPAAIPRGRPAADGARFSSPRDNPRAQDGVTSHEKMSQLGQQRWAGPAGRPSFSRPTACSAGPAQPGSGGCRRILRSSIIRQRDYTLAPRARPTTLRLEHARTRVQGPRAADRAREHRLSPRRYVRRARGGARPDLAPHLGGGRRPGLSTTNEQRGEAGTDGARDTGRRSRPPVSSAASRSS